MSQAHKPPVPLRDMLQAMITQDASDLYLAAKAKPKFSLQGNFVDAAEAELTEEDTSSYAQELMSPDQKEEFRREMEVNLAFATGEEGRFRVNIFTQRGSVAIVIRRIKVTIPKLEELGLPPLLGELIMQDRGLLLMTGATGSGKSTTLAAMIDYRNERLGGHIVTIEDPIEFVHAAKQSVIVHREVGDHTASFAAALKGAMRHDPDIILLGEMRELETMKLALSCASMGMLVFGTLHTNNAPKTIDRIINAFPAEEQNQVRVMLASCLAGVVAQLLCKRVPRGRVAVHEILLPHEALANTIRSGMIANIRGIIEAGTADGMISMDGSLLRVLNEGLITPEEAYAKAANKALFTPFLGTVPAAH